MKKMSSLEIREQFLKYFEENDHLKIGASSVVPQNDPTLLFINSGMAPLKNYFLGRETPPSPRLANFQPCIRTKDIDDVGDRHHLTIFEMMGSWSIGDYYKDKACSLAYNLLVDGFGFDPKKLYFTVYGGNESLGIAPDTESIEAWKKCGVPEDHIVVLGDDNFWGPAGDHGPCGPCTEVFYDTGEQYGPTYTPGGHFDDVSRYIEIWNAGVFMELNKLKDGTFESLPLKSVDTGSGLERLAMVMNGCDSVYETDLLKPLVDLSAELINSNDVQTTRMISDHMRASVMILSEGVMPGNEGQGYIPRRLIRKCVAACIARGVEKPDFKKHIDKTIEILGDYYPQLKSARDAIVYNIEQEVKDFSATVKQALALLESNLDQILKKDIFDGKWAFELVTTHGLPKDVLDMFAKQKGWTIDEEGYEKCYEEHRKASRVISRKGSLSADQEKVEEAFMSDADTEFTGYESLVDTSKVIKIYGNDGLVKKASAGESVYFTTQKTPFYGESGGQAGDQGTAQAGNAKLDIIDTMKIKGKHVHVAEIVEGELTLNSEITLTVDQEVRNASMRNHSATHLLHAALHEVIGKHAIQKGSMVSSERLRFDFQNPGAVSKEDLDKVETLVNTWIMNNTGRDTKLCGYEEAIEAGAMALFGEKYDSKVRVVSFGSESVELCGGTHVSSTGDIGLFLITQETSVAKGIRRIEAVTGAAAIKLMQERNLYLRNVAEELNVKPSDVATRVKDLKKEMKQKIKEAQANAQKTTSFLKEVKLEVNGVNFFAGVMEADAKAIKAIGDDLLNKGEVKLICLVGKEEKSLKTFVWSHDDVNKKVKAGDLLKKVLEPVSGRGGGKPHFAQGGSPEVNNLDKLTASLESEVKDWLSSNL
ncbi:alanine--tRNA ligase [Bacteriovorax sp. DB6_IX]|uniref:alanine--tRNA ligase n=1 Tax=Bacteriovorax sp. DB6_IX TaxID=1353530 RepID=UPI00038A29ED|nr:alanine--tRNA ligase [Bacteriovorax sp. DB6_IX]EQC50866.1 alanine--tRNA ligase [Bacteriovorax sp. DB6_IX]